MGKLVGRNIFGDLIKYGSVAVFALIADAGSLFALHAVGVNYLIAATVAFLLGTIVNFTLSHGYVFKDPVIKNKGVNFAAYALIGLLSLLFNNIIIWIIYSKLGLGLVFAKIIAVGIVFFWNFWARRRFLYHSHKNEELSKEISFEA